LETASELPTECRLFFCFFSFSSADITDIVDFTVFACFQVFWLISHFKEITICCTKSTQRRIIMWKDFKAFLFRGNVIDLAVAVVIGAAFGKIITSLVDNIIMPCIGMLTSNIDFADMKYVLKPEVLDKAGEVIESEVAIGYGILINNVVQFVIIAFVIFLVIRLMNKAKEKMEKLTKKQEEEKKEPEKIPEDIVLLTEIRDYLKAKNT